MPAAPLQRGSGPNVRIRLALGLTIGISQPYTHFCYPGCPAPHPSPAGFKHLCVPPTKPQTRSPRHFSTTTEQRFLTLPRQPVGFLRELWSLSVSQAQNHREENLCFISRPSGEAPRPPFYKKRSQFLVSPALFIQIFSKTLPDFPAALHLWMHRLPGASPRQGPVLGQVKPRVPGRKGTRLGVEWGMAWAFPGHTPGTPFSQGLSGTGPACLGSWFVLNPVDSWTICSW